MAINSIGLNRDQMQKLAQVLKATKNWEDTKEAFPNLDSKMLEGFKTWAYKEAGLKLPEPPKKVDPLK